MPSKNSVGKKTNFNFFPLLLTDYNTENTFNFLKPFLCNIFRKKKKTRQIWKKALKTGKYMGERT